MEIKTKINKWDLIKFTSFSTQNHKLKRQPIEREKIFGTNKRLIFKIHRQLTIKKTNNPVKNWPEDLN